MEILVQILYKKKFHGRNFDVEPISDNLLPNYISIYLYNKKNLEASKILLELSSKVRATGITEDIADKLGKLTKSDVVQHEFTNIRDDIIQRYEDAEYNIRYKHRSRIYRQINWTEYIKEN